MTLFGEYHEMHESTLWVKGTVCTVELSCIYSTVVTAGIEMITGWKCAKCPNRYDSRSVVSVSVTTSDTMISISGYSRDKHVGQSVTIRRVVLNSGIERAFKERFFLSLSIILSSFVISHKKWLGSINWSKNA